MTFLIVVLGHGLPRCSHRRCTTRRRGPRASLRRMRPAHTTGARCCATCSPTMGWFGDLAALRDQPELFDQVASTSTRAGGAEEVTATRTGLPGCGRRWPVCGRPRWCWRRPGGAVGHRHRRDPGHRPLRKEGAAPTCNEGFGFGPLVCYLDPGDGSGEALSGSYGRATPAPTLPRPPGRAGDGPARAAQCGACQADPGPGRLAAIAHAFVEELHRRGAGVLDRVPAGTSGHASHPAPADGWLPAQTRTTMTVRCLVCELASLDLAGWPPST
jgi:hypothetical protein